MAEASYGVLAQIVATGGSLIAAAAALALTWKGRFHWEPVEEDIPKGAQKIGGLLIAIVITILWYRSHFEGSMDGNALIQLALLFGFSGLAALIVYTLLVGVLVYEKQIAITRNATKSVKVIGGFWLTRQATEALRSGDPRPHSIRDLFIGAQYNEDLVWPRFSRSLAKACFQLAYIALVGLGTSALAAISLLVASTMK